MLPTPGSFMEIQEPENGCVWNFALDSAVDGDPGHGVRDGAEGDGGDRGGEGLRLSTAISGSVPVDSGVQVLLEARKKLLTNRP
jgi:hypothetical protein